MSHTSSQSSHNPAPDTGPPIDPVWEALTDTNQRLQKLEAIVLHMNDRIEQQAPLLINISARLEALEERADINTKAVAALSDWLGDIEDRLDRTGKVVELPAHGIIGTEKDLNNWNNEGGR